MKSIAAILLALALLPGCVRQWSYVRDTGSNTADPIGICMPADLAARSDISEAIGAWRWSLRGWRPVVVNGAACTITVEEAEPSACDTKDALACADRLGGHWIYLVRGRWTTDPRGVMLHEIGHVLGAQHLGGTLMAPNLITGRYSCPDLETVIQVAAYQRANLTLFSWCY